MTCINYLEQCLPIHRSKLQKDGPPLVAAPSGPFRHRRSRHTDSLWVHSQFQKAIDCPAQEELEGSMKELLQGELHMRAQDITSDCLQMNYEVRAYRESEGFSIT